jgi:hypothetical protein
MRKTILTLVPVIGLLLPVTAPAQGTLYVSNLNEPSVGGGAVASDEWLAGVFHTGTNSGGYDLNSVQLLMNAASGSPSGFTVSLFNSNGANPVSSLGSLNGSTNPSATGIFSYAASGLNLQPSTQYWIVLAATTPLAIASYSWSEASTPSYSSSANWGLGQVFSSSDNGLSWDRTGSIPQFAIYATAVPEPATPALVGLGLAALSIRRRKA